MGTTTAHGRDFQSFLIFGDVGSRGRYYNYPLHHSPMAGKSTDIGINPGCIGKFEHHRSGNPWCQHIRCPKHISRFWNISHLFCFRILQEPIYHGPESFHTTRLDDHQIMGHLILIVQYYFHCLSCRGVKCLFIKSHFLIYGIEDKGYIGLYFSDLAYTHINELIPSGICTVYGNNIFSLFEQSAFFAIELYVLVSFTGSGFGNQKLAIDIYFIIVVMGNL